MDHTSVTVDVYSDSGVDPSAYWIWPSYEIFIREHIVVLADPGKHQVRIERCQGSSNFSVRGFTVNGVAHDPDNLSFNITS